MEENYQFAVRRETLHNIHSYSYELEHLLSGHSDAFRGKCTSAWAWWVLVQKHTRPSLLSFPVQNHSGNSGNIVFPLILVCKEHLSGVFFSLSQVHQGQSSLPVSQCATQKCGHSFTFPAYFAPPVGLAPALLWRWNSMENQGWVGEFKGPLLRFWTWEEVDVPCHYLMSPSGQHNTHWSPWINYGCLEEWQHVYTN